MLLYFIFLALNRTHINNFTSLSNDNYEIFNLNETCSIILITFYWNSLKFGSTGEAMV